MLNRVLNFFRDPADADPSFIRLTRNILIVTMVANIGIFLLVTGLIPGTEFNLPALSILLGTLLLEGISLGLVQRGRLGMAKFIVPVGLLTGVTYIAIVGGGIHDTSVFIYPVVVVISALLLGQKARYFTTPITILAVEIVIFADITGINRSIYAARTGLQDALLIGILVLVMAEILQLLIRRLNEIIQRAQANERLQVEANRDLRELQSSLEQRVAERTAELDAANQRNERRARQFEAIAQVTRTAATLQEESLLLDSLAQVISDRFGFYHTGIFTIDEKREYAVLRAANSEGGKRMLKRGHKLKIGQTGIVGFVVASGTPRIALDVGDDAAFFDNPDLPGTRSELALPIRVGGEVIGALDAQSVEPNAFQQEDADILATLADQIAIAIQNARSYETTQRLLSEAQTASLSYLKDSWQILRAEQKQVGYVIANDELKPLARPVSSPHLRKALHSGETVLENGKTAILAVPIRLRDEIIGVMDVRAPEEHEWDPDEVDIIEAVAERLSLAVESSLLLDATRRRAEIERLTADISGKISSSTQFDAILRTAAEELSRVLGGSEVLVQIQPPSSSGFER